MAIFDTQSSGSFVSNTVVGFPTVKQHNRRQVKKMKYNFEGQAILKTKCSYSVIKVPVAVIID